eukprot:TRINITY_DN75673_c0_g1_i1.p3 TRINITY_DN75673_c0_g1~~TRINITY_DN75673_c0_g1_i1.p3  ORF type:complete len:133 (+),score=32.62 TRINITY_DN75673_c0_g1_i1:56-400(+)
MPLPLILGGLGLGAGAWAARSGLRAWRASGLKAPKMPDLGGFRTESLSGFEAPMSRSEARSILNVRQAAPSKEAIRDAHRRLLVANHPDKGGSTFLASKINEAKDVLLGRKAAH